MIEEKLQATSKYWTVIVMFTHVSWQFIGISTTFSPQDKNFLSILPCHFLPIKKKKKKIGKKLLNIFRNLFLHYISCTVIWILNFKNCSKLIAKCWRHVRSIYHPKPRSKNHPWSIVTLAINVWPSSLWLLSLPL